MYTTPNLYYTVRTQARASSAGAYRGPETSKMTLETGPRYSQVDQQ